MKNKTIHGLAHGLLAVGVYGGIELLILYGFDYELSKVYHYTAIFWIAYSFRGS